SMTGDEVAAGISAKEVDLVEGQKNCFQLVSKVGGKTSKPTPVSDAMCVPVAADTGSGSGSGTIPAGGALPGGAGAGGAVTTLPGAGGATPTTVPTGGPRGAD